MLHIDPSAPIDVLLHVIAYSLTGGSALVLALLRIDKGGSNGG